jgi:sigma-E factor negative regulatory protein RseA
MLVNQLPEKMSLLLDGELDQEESLKLLDLIETDPELRKRWRRYCLVRESMRSRQKIWPDDHFVKEISAALVSEPTVLVPSRTARTKTRDKMVTMALAASLALLAILVGKSLHDHSAMDRAQLTARLEGPIHYPDLPSGNSEFQDYLVFHNETAYLAGAQGMLPYLRLVSSQAPR